VSKKAKSKKKLDDFLVLNKPIERYINKSTWSKKQLAELEELREMLVSDAQAIAILKEGER